MLANRAFDSALAGINFTMFNIHKGKAKNTEFVITAETYKCAMASVASFAS